MEWILRCSMGDAAFNKDIEDEIPILCKYFRIIQIEWPRHRDQKRFSGEQRLKYMLTD
jgi:hypothetical protein